jgi:hypothetical protein
MNAIVMSDILQHTRGGRSYVLTLMSHDTGVTGVTGLDRSLGPCHPVSLPKYQVLILLSSLNNFFTPRGYEQLF